MRSLFGLSTVGLVGAILSVGTVRAGEIIFDNLGPGDTYNAGGGGGSVVGQAALVPTMTAATFTPSTTAAFTELVIPLSVASGYAVFDDDPYNADVYVSLTADNGGTPGAVLESWYVSALPAYSSTADSVVQNFFADTSITLTTGTPYWIEISPASEDTGVYWNGSLTPGSNAIFSEAGIGQNFGPWMSEPVELAFEVLSPIPEPSSLSLLGVGIALTVAFRRLRASGPCIRSTRI